MLNIGDKIPSVNLQTDEGQMVNLTDYADRKLIVYFYPKDNTPGCTNEAVSFEEARADLFDRGFTILGISSDSIKSHVNFKNRYDLGFTLLSDPQKEAAEAFGVWGEKVSFGKKIFGIHRSTFLFDNQGIVTRVYPKVAAAGHGTEVLDDIIANGL